MFFSLLYGIHIKEFRTTNVTLEELYIKWNEKLIISVKKAIILPSTSKSQEKRTPTNPKKVLEFITSSYEIFEKIDIRYIQYKDITASVLYTEKTNGYFTLDSKYAHIQGDIYIDDNNIGIQLASLVYNPLKIKSHGYIVFDKPNKTIESFLNIDIAGEALFDLNLNLENQILHYRADFLKPIENTAKILNMIDLPKPVRYWAITAIKAKNVDVKKLEGTINLNDPSHSYKDIHVIAIANALSYTYHPKIAPIDTTYTLLEFTNGVLYIKPKNPTTYGYDLQNSYLKIDFTLPEELLTLYLKFDKGKLDKNILHILSTYGIDVPLVQNSGFTQTDLIISVSLRNIDVNAKGKFIVTRGNFRYLGLDIDVKDVVVWLENSHISVHNMYANYSDMIHSHVTLDLKLAKHTGMIQFDIDSINLKKNSFKLAKPLQVTYKINKIGTDTIEIPSSQWLYADNKITLDPLKIPFDFKHLEMNLPITRVVHEDKDIMLFSGLVALKEKKADIDIDIIKMKHKNFKMAQSNIYLKLLATPESIQIKTNKDISILFGKTELLAKPFTVTLKNNTASARNFTVKTPKLFQTTFNFDYDISNRQGELLLLEAKLGTKELENILQIKEPVRFRLFAKDNFKISSKKLAVFFKVFPDGTSLLSIRSLKKLLPYSKLLQKYKIKDGEIELNGNFDLTASLSSQYALLIQREKKVDTYKINGTLGEKSRLSINKNIQIDMAESIRISAHDIGIDIVELEKLIDALSQDTSRSSPSTHFYVNVQDGYFFISEARRIIFDSLDMQVINDETTAQLTYKDGNAGFRYKGDNFYLYGSNFYDTFMNNLFFQSKFKGGRLDFNIVGKFQDYKGIFEIEDTTILDYKVLNNILAFIDTIPSLVTFSLPKYSKEGFKVHKAYASFHYKDHIFDFDNINLDSDQFDIIGVGKASYKYDFIDLVLQLKTNFANKASKVPVAGYILFDGKTISTTLKVKGKLEDPEVTTMLAKDIVVAPLNIIKRTVLYPLHLFGLDK